MSGCVALVANAKGYNRHISKQVLVCGHIAADKLSLTWVLPQLAIRLYLGLTV